VLESGETLEAKRRPGLRGVRGKPMHAEVQMHEFKRITVEPPEMSHCIR
jgi:hypothetical protein